MEVAQALGAPLDVLTVRKLGAPGNPELGVGAVAEDGTVLLNTALVRRLGMTQAQLDRTVERELTELKRRIACYRDGREPLDVRGRTVIVVDDGLATGLSDLAAVRSLRRRGAGRIVVAVPVGSQPAVSMLEREADQVLCHTVPPELLGVGGWYRDFTPVSDEQVLALLNGPVPRRTRCSPSTRELSFELETGCVRGDLSVPPGAHGLVVFAHGSGSSRHSARNRAVASVLQQGGLATLLFDLLTEREERRRESVFDIPLLAERLERVTRLALADPTITGMPVGYFGASTGAAAAVRAASTLDGRIGAVVSRGGRPDLAGDRLAALRAPLLLIVGSLDREVLELNRRAAGMLRCPHRLEVVDGAGHLFEEPGALGTVARLASGWFATHLSSELAPPAPPTAVG